MSDITGLSQSQVYKWWWDQKKKNMKYQKDRMTHLPKKKLIKKDHKSLFQEADDDEFEDDYEEINTKAKNMMEFTQLPDTQKKINKRLTF